MNGTNPAQDELMRILADVGAVTSSEGLIPGSGVLKIVMRPIQMARLARFLPNQGIEALGLALEYGVLRLDPFRVEVQGWSRDWLQAQGMGPTAARTGIKALKEAGIAVSTVGPDGIRGKRLGVIGAAHCGWDVGNVVPIHDGRPEVRASGRLVTKSPGDDPTNPTATKPQVSMVGGKAANHGKPVDNMVGGNPANHETTSSPAAADDSPSVQVKKVGRKTARRETDPSTTSSSVPDQIELSARGVLTSRSLTLADVHTLVSSPALHEAAVNAGDGLLVHLTNLLSRADRDKMAAVVEFHGYTVGDAPHMVIAALLAQVMQTDPDDRDDITNDLFDRCRAGKANLPRPPAEEFLAGWILTMTGAMVSDVSAWGGWVNSGIRRPSWNVSPVMLDVLACFAHLAEAGSLTGAPVPVTGRDSSPAGSGTGVTSGEPVVRVDPFTGEWPAGVMEELRAAVAGTAFADEVMFENAIGNAAWVNKTLTRWRNRTSTGASDSVAEGPPAAMEEPPAVDAGAPTDGSEGEDLEGGMTDEERLVAHAEMLAEIVTGTKWETEQEWERLLANPTLQSRLLHRHKVNQILITQGGNALSLDSIT